MCATWDPHAKLYGAYGLRTAPREWQYLFADELRQVGFQGLNSDGHVYITQY